MNHLHTTIALAVLLASAPLAAASDTYRFNGTLEGKACSGTLTLAKGPKDHGAERSFSVTQRIEIGSSEHIELSGQGRWISHDRAQATLRLRGGIASRVSPLRSANGKTLRLTFTLGGRGGSWWQIRGSLNGASWLDARGDIRIAQPGEITISNGAHGALEGVPFLRDGDDHREIQGNDVHQGQLGNCYLLASMAAVAHFRPERIRDRLRSAGPGVSQVKIYERWYQVSHEPVLRQGQPVYARGDSVQRNGRTIHELWPMLFEKAAAAHVGGYDSLISGPTWEGLNMLGYKTDLVVCTLAPRLERTLTRAIAAKRPMVVGFVPLIGRTSLAKRLNIKSSHAYALVAKQGNGFVLRNPWGHSHPSRPLTASDLRKLLASISIAK